MEINDGTTDLHHVHVKEDLEARGAHGHGRGELRERVRFHVQDILQQPPGGPEVGRAVGQLELAEKGGAVADTVAALRPLFSLGRVAEERVGEQAEGAEGELVVIGEVVGGLRPVEEVGVRVVPAVALRGFVGALCAYGNGAAARKASEMMADRTPLGGPAEKISRAPIRGKRSEGGLARGSDALQPTRLRQIAQRSVLPLGQSSVRRAH